MNGSVVAQEVPDSESYKDPLRKVHRHLFSNPDSAFYYLEQAKERVTGNRSGQIEVNKFYGIFYDTQSKYDSAIYFYELSAGLAIELQEDESYADVMTNLGLALSRLGNLGLAQEKLLEALNYYEANNLPEKQANVYSNMGIVFQKSEDLTQAKNFYKKANAIHPNGHLGSLANLATVYERENKPDSAIAIYDSMIVALKEINHLMGLSEVYLNTAIAYDNLGNGDKTLFYYDQAVILKKQLNDFSGLGISYQNLADYHFKQGNTAKTQAYLDSGYRAATAAMDLEVYTKLKNREAELASKTGKYRQAVEAYVAFNQLKDSLHRQEQSAVVQELNIKYETAANRQKITQLELEQKNVALSLIKSQNQRNIFISAFVILVILAGFLFYQYRTKKKTSEILSTKNVQISEALAEREILLKEIHHRVKNNLQVISSLLYLQAESLDDEAAIDAVRQGQHRVAAMGLIHQRLYSADDVRGVDIQGYFEQLCAEIITVFGDEENEIAYEVETNKLKLDIDTVIPLGLIVNELITNAIKYAFQEKGEGKIVINVRHEGERLLVQVKDNGIGMTEESLKKANSFGWKMMRSLSRKLKAEINIINDSGTTVDLILARYKLVE